MGVPPEKIRVVFNRVEADVSEEFPYVLAYAKKEKTCIANPDAAIFENDLFDALGVKKLTVSALLADETDYKALLRKPDASEKERNNWAELHGLKLLARGVNRNLDAVYDVLFK